MHSDVVADGVVLELKCPTVVGVALSTVEGLCSERASRRLWEALIVHQAQKHQHCSIRNRFQWSRGSTRPQPFRVPVMPVVFPAGRKAMTILVLSGGEEHDKKVRVSG